MLKTNTKIVNQRIEDHVKEYYPSIVDLKADLKAVLRFGGTYQRGLVLRWQQVIDFFESKINFYIKNGFPVPAKFKNYRKKLKLEFI